MGEARRSARGRRAASPTGTACGRPSSGASARRSTTASTPRARPGPRRRAPRPPGTERTMSHELAAANAGAGCLEPGWRVVGEDGRAPHRPARRPAALGRRRGDRGRDGDSATTSRSGCPRSLPAYSPGFYIARGDRGFSAELPRVLDRFYLDVRPEGAVPFVREATRRLNHAGLAFSAKVVDDPAASIGATRRCSPSSAATASGRSSPPRTSARRSPPSSTAAPRR